MKYILSLFILCIFAHSATMYVASRTNSELYRYEVTENNSAILNLTLQDPNFNIVSDYAQHSSGKLYASDVTGNKVVQIIDPVGAPSVAPEINSGGPVVFSNPAGMSFRGDNLFVANFSRGEILRFVLGNDGNFSFAAATTGLSSALRFLEVGPNGNELFATFCCGQNFIQRFTIDANGDLQTNGTISGNALSNPHDIVFNGQGEMFVANIGNSTVSRFLFDGNGNATANGFLSGNGIGGGIGLDFAPWGELFISSHDGLNISRFTFDVNGNASANGFFAAPTLMSGLTFVENAENAVPEPSTYLLLLVAMTFFSRHYGFTEQKR